jgi:hypothetical protein
MILENPTNRSKSANSRPFLASLNSLLPHSCCCFAFVHLFLVRFLPNLHPKPRPVLLNLPLPYQGLGVLLPTTFGNVLLPAIPSSLQKNDGHPNIHEFV